MPLLSKNYKTYIVIELKWIRRGAKARSTKQKARKDRFEEIRCKSRT